jgi:hypothetical protein
VKQEEAMSLAIKRWAMAAVARDILAEGGTLATVVLNGAQVFAGCNYDALNVAKDCVWNEAGEVVLTSEQGREMTNAAIAAARY